MTSTSSLPMYGIKTGPGSLASPPSSAQIPEYVRRLFQYPQMDIDYTLWQMLYLCISPNRVYRTTKYHRQTKNQWARDDPAFVAIMTYFMSVAAAGYMFAFQVTPSGFFKGLFYAVFVDWIAVGIIAATIGWYISNNYLLLEQQGSHATEQKVEWQYSFDIHCNSFTPLFVLLYVVQYFLLLVFLRDGFVFTLLANGLYMFAFSYYFYITFLGYQILPFLQHTTVFLYPIFLVLAVGALGCLLRINIAKSVMNFYFSSGT